LVTQIVFTVCRHQLWVQLPCFVYIRAEQLLPFDRCSILTASDRLTHPRTSRGNRNK